MARVKETQTIDGVEYALVSVQKALANGNTMATYDGPEGLRLQVVYDFIDETLK